MSNSRLRAATHEETYDMNVDDLILVSIDDHVVEPPVVVTADKGVDGLSARVGADQLGHAKIS